MRSRSIGGVLGAAVSIGATALLGACTTGEPDSAPLLALQEMPSPAGAGSAEPNLFAAAGRFYLSWLEPAADGANELRLSVLDLGAGGATPAWSEPHTIARGRDFFVNWADFPSVVALPDGSLAAHWLVRSGPATYAYDVHIARSTDGGVTWSNAVVPHRDGTRTEHGFVSLFPWPGGGLAAIWLDGRKFAGAEPSADADAHHGTQGSSEMTLRQTTIGAQGELGPELLLDDRTCDCCQTAAALTSAGPVAVYRDRSPDEVRDIAISRYVDGDWTEPRPVHEDGWVIAACPVNGPAVAAAGRRVAVAWFTAAQDTARVRVAFSEDAGATFGSPVRIDEGDPAGRVDIELLPDGALVSWLERTPEGAEVRVRRVRADGSSGPSLTITTSTAERASGFPQLARSGGDVVIAWTQPGSAPRVHVARARLPGR